LEKGEIGMSTQAPATKALAPIDELRSSLQKMEEQFKLALPSQIPSEKFVRVVLTAVQANPDLLAADRRSLYGACMKSAQDGLLPDGREAALVIFKTKNGPMVQYMPMFGGLLKKVRNSGELAAITAQVVREHDKFRYWVDGDGEHLEHEPLMFGERGKIIGVYALAKTKDEAVYIEVLTETQVQDVRNVSRAKDSGPWTGPFSDEMRRKTAIRRLSKRLPMSSDLDAVFRNEDELFDFSGSDESPAPARDVGPKPSRLSQAMAQADAPPTQAKAAEAKPETEPAPNSEPPWDSGPTQWV
jgi:recombination protein RecT